MQRIQPVDWFFLIALTFIWGSSYILIKKSLLIFSATELTCLRVSISMLASLLLVPKALKTIPAEKYKYVFMTGLLGSALPAFLFAFSMTRINSSITGVVNSLSPLFTMLTGILFFHQIAVKEKITGVVIGFAGAALLIILKPDGKFNGDMLWAILPVIATFCYGLSGNIVKEKLPQSNSLYLTAMAMLMVGTPCFIASFYLGIPAKIAHTDGGVQALTYVTFLAVFGTFIAWMMYYSLVQRTDALFASSVTYLIPVVAVAWGIYDGEKFSVFQLMGMALILVGVWFVSRKVNVEQVVTKA
jgi:drug/metabolite transporter (DMT)-like permease